MKVYCKDCIYIKYKVGMYGEPRGQDCFCPELIKWEEDPITGRHLYPNYEPNITNANFDCKYWKEYIEPIPWWQFWRRSA